MITAECIGYLGSDARVTEFTDKDTAEHKIILGFSVAHSWGKEENRRTVWVDVVKTYAATKENKDSAEKFASHLLKGTRVFVSGRSSVKNEVFGGSVKAKQVINLSRLEFLGDGGKEAKEVLDKIHADLVLALEKKQINKSDIEALVNKYFKKNEDN